MKATDLTGNKQVFVYSVQYNRYSLTSLHF